MEAAIKNLSFEEKIALVEELREEIDKEGNPTLSAAQMKHIHERVLAYNSNPQIGKNWEELKPKYPVSKAQKDLLDERKSSHLQNPKERISFNQFIAKYSS